MKIEDVLVERFCPSCESTDADVLFTMVKQQFLQNNPTHNLIWFEKLIIPEDFKFPFLRCRKCKFVYTKFRLNDPCTFEFYNEGINVDKSKAKVFKKAKRIQQTEIWLNLLKQYHDKPELKLVDYGGGWGDFLAIAKSYAVHVFGLEFDQRKIDYARSQGIPLSDMAFIEANAPYDLFMCNQVMEHLNEPKESLKHLRSLLLPGAIGFVGVPDFNEAYLQDNITLIKNNGIPPKEINPFGHLNYFSPETFVRMLEQTGFKVIDKTRPKGRSAKLMGALKKKFTAQEKESKVKGNLFYVKAV